jgi:hypothetical protein
LGDIHDRVSGKARGAGRQKNIAWGGGYLQVARDHRDYDSLDAAAVEGVCLDHQHRLAKSGLGAARLGKIRPPNLAALKLAHRRLPRVLVEGSKLRAVQCRIDLRRLTRVHFIQAFRDGIDLTPVQEF